MAFIRGRRLIIFLLAPAAFIRGRRLFEGGVYSSNYGIYNMQELRMPDVYDVRQLSEQTNFVVPK